MRRWWRYNGPKQWARVARAFYQRGRRGWSDSDTWGFDSYLCRVIADGTRHMAEIAHGYPGEFSREFGSSLSDDEAAEKWKSILLEIAEGFDAGRKYIACEYDYRDKAVEAEIKATHDNGMSLFKQWFFHLWD